MSMDQFVTRPVAEVQAHRRKLSIWSHALTEVTGRMKVSYKHGLLQSMLRSFSEIGSFPQYVDDQGLPPSIDEHGFNGHEWGLRTHVSRSYAGPRIVHKPQISGLAFDSQGVYLASVSNTGSLAVHDYESLLCSAEGLSKEEFVSPVVQLLVCPKLESVAWNPQNQDEVACVSGYVGKLFCYDISRVSERPSQVLKVSASSETAESTGLLDLAFCRLHEKRMLACGKNRGELYVWDRRTSVTPQSVYSSYQHGQLTSMDLTSDEQVVYAGNSSGYFFAWDLRGGKSSTAFIRPGEVYNPPFATWKVTRLLEQIPALKAQTAIEMSGIQSISLNRGCQQQLAFHLNNGWSGVLDLLALKMSHIHCPPPPWLYDDLEGDSRQKNANLLAQRKPTWLSANSVYACPSLSSSFIKLLNFQAGPSSPHYVEGTEDNLAPVVQIATSEHSMTCAAHPLNNQIVAGTNGASILVFACGKNLADEDEK
ncbi:hypothetical protein KP509_07G042100 [Ceratopteris richardii]|uniref:Uncharacterized protein n=1 Tax=Ceratopteris richardii TaxID=49495 RepID=A0A8T2UKI9_CERRI|nr:hypothetical protein KP509_07G042100 [Ceratopteris richardii]